MPDHPPLRLGTRGSKLALIQAENARAAIFAASGRDCHIVTVSTTGDRVQDKPLAEIGGKALFAKELEEALLAGQIDFAVHSLKDLPVDLPPGLQLTAVMTRESPYDALVLPKGEDRLAPSPRIGSCSVRRSAQIRRAMADAVVSPLRGNVDTRLRRLDAGDYDALVLAHAGLIRLGLDMRVSQLLDPNIHMPALSQGVIGIESRADDDDTNQVLAMVDDADTALCIAAERGFQSGLGGTCHSPVAGLARIEAGILHFSGRVIAPDGAAMAQERFSMPLEAQESARARIWSKALAVGRKMREDPLVLSWLGECAI